MAMRIVVEFADHIKSRMQVKGFCRNNDISKVVLDSIESDDLGRNIINYKGDTIATIKIEED